MSEKTTSITTYFDDFTAKQDGAPISSIVKFVVKENSLEIEVRTSDGNNAVDALTNLLKGAKKNFSAADGKGATKTFYIEEQALDMAFKFRLSREPALRCEKKYLIPEEPKTSTGEMDTKSIGGQTLKGNLSSRKGTRNPPTSGGQGL